MTGLSIIAYPHRPRLAKRQLAKGISPRFGQSRLLAKYGIDPNQVKVVASEGIKLDNKGEVIERILQAHEHARKNKILGNFSDFHPAYNIQMADNSWHLATLVETSRDVTICAERSAIVSGVNDLIKGLSLDALSLPGRREEALSKFKIKMLVSASHFPPGEGPAGKPCADCSDWLASSTFTNPDTLLAFLNKDTQGQLVLNLYTLKDMYPQRDTHQASASPRDIKHLSNRLLFSPKGMTAYEAQVKKGMPVSADKLVELMTRAKAEFDENETAEHSGKRTGTAVLFNTGDIFAKGRFDVTKRWSTDAGMLAMAEGTQTLKKQGVKDPKVVAVAYYSKNEAVPSIYTLGRYAQPTRGGVDTLIVTAEPDNLRVRTITDYMSRPYISSLSSSKRH